MSDSIGIYLNEIGKVALLNAEDERDLSKAIEAGREAKKRHEKGERSAQIRADIANAARPKNRFHWLNLPLGVWLARVARMPQRMGCVVC